jgi:hypothetical protein
LERFLSAHPVGRGDQGEGKPTSICGGRHLGANVGERKQPARTVRGPHVSMPDDVRGLDFVPANQLGHQAMHGVELPVRRRSLIKVADQHDSNSVLVIVLDPGMGSRDLSPPAERGFDFPVVHAAAVADHEVITNSLPGTSVAILVLQVGIMNRFHAARC